MNTVFISLSVCVSWSTPAVHSCQLNDAGLAESSALHSVLTQLELIGLYGVCQARQLLYV